MSESQTVLPPLPSSVPSILGPVAVVVVPDLLTRENEPALGLWVPEERTIKLCAGVHPTTMLVTLWHERIPHDALGLRRGAGGQR